MTDNDNTMLFSICLLSSRYKVFIAGFLLTSLMTMTGCVNYFGIGSTKKIAQPSQFQTNKSIPKQKGHWPTTDWAKEFGDPQLSALIKEALANNPSLQVSQARIAQTRALAGRKSSVLLPSVRWESDIDTVRLSSTVFPPMFGGGKWQTLGAFLYKLNYELDIWGKNLSDLKETVSEEKANEAAAQEARLVLASSVASAYNQLAYYYALQELLRRTVAQREVLQKIAAVRLRAGLDTNVQLYQSLNTTATARTQLLDSEGQIRLIRQQLGTLLGAGPSRGLSIKRPQLLTVKTPALPPNLPLNLLGRRPDIIGARWRVEAACYGVNSIKAEFYPNINIMAVAGFLSFGLDRLFEIASEQAQIGPALRLPIFDASALRAKLREQYAKYEEAVANYNTTLNEALSDVANKLTSIQSIDKQLISQKEALSAVERAYNLARYQYRIGLASQLVVLDAESRYLAEQEVRLQLVMNRRNLQIALVKALGGGFGANCLQTVKPG